MPPVCSKGGLKQSAGNCEWPAQHALGNFNTISILSTYQTPTMFTKSYIHIIQKSPKSSHSIHPSSKNPKSIPSIIPSYSSIISTSNLYTTSFICELPFFKQIPKFPKTFQARRLFSSSKYTTYQRQYKLYTSSTPQQCWLTTLIRFTR